MRHLASILAIVGPARRVVAAARRRPASVVALAVLVLAGGALELHHRAPRLPLPRQVAIAAVLRDSSAADALKRLHVTRAEATAIDSRLERVSFFAGPRVAFEAAVRPDRSVEQTQDFAARRVPYGNWLAYRPAALVLLCLLFVLMAGVVPLRRLRNLDVGVLISFVAPVILLQQRLLEASVVVAAPALAYLSIRCAWVALGSARGRPSIPLYDWVTRNWSQRQRLRTLRMALVAVTLALLMVGVSSAGAVDVLYAVMEGATKLLHGMLPYGHMPGDVIHGDTYPILSYALYTPVALLAPVGSIWDSVDVGLGVCVLAALLAGAGTRCAAVCAGERRSRPAQGDLAGLRGALTWLCFPPLLIIVSTGTTDVVLGAMLVWAVVLWRRPAASTALLALAGWFKLAPFALLPIWLAPLRGRRLLAALAGFAAVSAAAVGLIVAVAGPAGVSAMVHAIGFQWDRGSLQSVWHALGIEALQPVGQACVLALIAGAAVRLRSAPELFARPTRVAALSAAILLGLQLTADYWAFLYLVWIVPLVGMSLLAEPATATLPARVVFPAREVGRPAPVSAR